MSDQTLPENTAVSRRKFHYGWVIVAACTLMMAVAYGLMYSYSVFFKPLADYFNWDRATVSVIYSASLIIRGAVSIGVGWLADRYGAVKILAFCGFMIGLGLVLSSRVTEFWQFFITYSIIEAIGLSGAFGIATAVTTRWFVKNRGLALGIVSSGVGIGTLLIVPGNERLISAVGWSDAFVACGIAAGVIMIGSALFLHPKPRPILPPAASIASRKKEVPVPELTLGQALRTPRMIIMITIFSLIFFCTQIVIVHLVNYATDIGITPLMAATFVSIIGVVSISGRLIMGVGADKLGIYNTLIICCLLLTVSMGFLVITHEIWAFYLFAVVFGFAYGGEVPQIPLFVGKFGGTRAMATLMGLTLFVGNIGGSLGPWVAGKIFDVTANYHWAFIVGTIVGLCSLILALILKRQNRETA